MYVPTEWQSQESPSEITELWIGDQYLNRLCQILEECNLKQWTVRPNTPFLIGAICESALYVTGRVEEVSPACLEVFAKPTLDEKGRIESVELTVKELPTDKIRVYCNLRPTVHGWTWESLIPNSVYQIMWG